VVFSDNIENFEDFEFKTGTSVALGTFDGVHIGHKAVISKAAEEKSRGLSCVVLTFSCSPKTINKNFHPLLITSQKEKKATIQNIGADYLINLDFENIKNYSPEEFVDIILIEKIKAKNIVCGFNYTFGVHASGNAELLSSLCNERGISVTVCESVMYKKLPVSSSRIRHEIKSGDMKNAKEMLGRYYSFEGMVINGKKLGRQLGAPTINQSLDKSCIIPRLGVYASQIALDDIIWPCVTNIGNRPTVGGKGTIAETYIIGYNGDLYDKNVKVELIQYIREEIKFNSIIDLRNRIQEDAQISNEIFKIK